jgi:hypothetical protein
MHGVDRRKYCAEILRPHFSSIIPLLLIPLIQPLGFVFGPDNAHAAVTYWQNRTGNNHNFINRFISTYKKEKINRRRRLLPGTYQDERRYNGRIQ